jgi:hypothetical protein
MACKQRPVFDRDRILVLEHDGGAIKPLHTHRPGRTHARDPSGHVARDVERGGRTDQISDRRCRGSRRR